MDQSPKTILLKILDTIEYRDDKELFCQKFFNLVAQETLGALVYSLPPDKKETVEDQLLEEKDPVKVQQIFHSTFTQIQIDQMLEMITQNAFRDYIKSIILVLNETQKKSVDELINGVIKKREENAKV